MFNGIAALEAARESIRRQFAERAADYPDQAPAHPWTKIAPVTSYVHELPAERLKQIRIHVDPLMGVHSGDHFLRVAHSDGTQYAKATGYDWLGDGVPPELWADDPEVPGLPQVPFGTSYRGKTINDFAVTNQQNVCNLWRMGASEIRGRVIFLEIGAGYGGFALNALRLFKDCTYVIVDLPETLIFSAAFLITHRPELKAYVYHPGDDLPAIMRDAGKYDLLFIPNYRADALKHLPRVTIGYNSLSFPEMKREAMRGYLERIAPRLTHWFVSVNYRGEVFAEGGGVDDELGKFFELTPTPAEYRRGLRLSGVQYDSLHCRPVLIGTTTGERRAELGGRSLREVSPLIGRVQVEIGPDSARVSKPPLLDRIRRRLGKARGLE